MRFFALALLGVVTLAACGSEAPASPIGIAAHDHDHERDPEDETPGVRALAQRTVSWTSSAAVRAPAHVRVLGFNDFHGQLSAGRKSAGRPVGGAEVFASYLRAAEQGHEGRTLLVHAGDLVGASPPASALLQDEPTIQFVNLLAGRQCLRSFRLSPLCNVVGTFGNHELDEGIDEALRLTFGGPAPLGPFLESPDRGARFPYVNANIVRDDGSHVLPPFVVKVVDGVAIGVIGAVLKDTPTVVTPTGVMGLRFLDEAEAINDSVRFLKAFGVRTIVVTIHQGGTQTPYAGATTDGAVSGPIVDIVSRLDDEVDLVVSGHTHSFTNALLPAKHGHAVLVTQAFSASTAFATVDLAIDRHSGDVVAKEASIVSTYADEGAGLVHQPDVAELVRAAETRTAPLVSRVVTTTTAAIAAAPNAAGESALGDLVADAQRAATGGDVALMNPGGIRADLPAGRVTWGDLFTVQPFGNTLVTVDLTGAELKAVLEQQWTATTTRILQISGFTYEWDAAQPVGRRIVAIYRNGALVEATATLRVTVNNFLAAGGDGFTGLVVGRNPVGGPVDLDALVTFAKAAPQPLVAAIDGRIARTH